MGAGPAGDGAPKEDGVEDEVPPNGEAIGLGAGAVPNGVVAAFEVAPNGAGAGAAAEPPNGFVDGLFPKGLAVAKPLVFGAPKGEFETAVVEPKPGEELVIEFAEKGDEAAKLVDAGAGVDPEAFGLELCNFSSGLGTLYFVASFWNISTSRPLRGGLRQLQLSVHNLPCRIAYLVFFKRLVNLNYLCWIVLSIEIVQNLSVVWWA